MFVEKVKLFIAKQKLLKALLILVAILAIGIAVFHIYSNHIAQAVGSTSTSDTTMGIIGTLLGAIVGGVFSFWGSRSMSRRAQKAQNAVKRNNIIYKPLYNELNEIHNEVLVSNPYPLMIRFEKDHQTMLKHPQYAVWGRIKLDARYFEVPIKLKKSMETLYCTIENYEKLRDAAITELDSVYRESLQRITNQETSVQANVGRSLLGCLMCGKRPPIDLLLWHTPKTEAFADELWNNLLGVSKSNAAFTQLYAIWHKWLEEEQTVLELLATYIQLVNVKYEGI